MRSEGPTATPPSGLPTTDPPPRPHTTFKGDVLRLVTGTGLAQIIVVLASPILTRLYGPEAFGAAVLFIQ